MVETAGEAFPPATNGYQLAALGRLAEAEAWFRSCGPHLSPLETYALGIVLLAQGRYGEGLAGYELRHAVLSPNRAPLPWSYWRGEDLYGKHLVIFPEQGLGDQIQFSRFAPILQERGATITLLCASALTRLFTSLDVPVTAASGQVSFPDPDYCVWSNSLLRVAGPSVEGVPGIPYLHVAPRASGARIGVAVRGNPSHPNDFHRSLPTAEVSRLLSLSGVINLDPSETGAADMLDTAQIVAGLDLVISVDTSVAHLAGALGKPVWVMLPDFNTDWRWMRGRPDSPWYPSARLIRQSTPGNWSDVVDRVIAELR